jgi:hypothetical protein
VEAFVAAGAALDDAEEAVGEVEEQAGVGGAGAEGERQRAGGFDRGDVGEGAAFGGDEGAIGERLDGPGDVGGGEGVAVVEADIRAKVEGPGVGVGVIPGGGEPGLEVEVVVAVDERVVEEGADALGLGVGALAEVEVVGAAFDEAVRAARSRRETDPLPRID